MKKKALKKAKKRFFVISILFLGIVSLSVASIFNDWLSIMESKQEMVKLSIYYSELLEEEESLTSEVTKLHDDEYIARYARERYMYSLPGEFIIKIPDE